MKNSPLDPVIIVGGGWAGLSAAVCLVEQGYSVRLFESAKQFGGRARCVPFADMSVDNGQHLLLGAYSETLNIMRTCNTDFDKVLLRQPLNWKLMNKQGLDVKLSASNLPAPFNILFAILGAQGYSLPEKIKTLRFMYSQHHNGFIIENDISVEALLSGQPKRVINTLWEPMCIAALNTPINIASAKIFLNVIRDSFTRHARDADTLYTINDLGQLFVQPAIDFIESKGSQVNLGQRIDTLDIHNNEIQAVHIGDERISASQVILASSASGCHKLLNTHTALSIIRNKLEQLAYQPICTLYLQYPENISPTEPMLGLSDMTGQWIFDRRFANQPGLMAVVISADGPHMKLDNETLTQLVSDELCECFGWPEPQQHLVVREKRATFSACINVDELRPETTTPVKGLWLAGDYTRSPYPSTLEAAVRSGVQCAQAIIQQTNRTPA